MSISAQPSKSFCPGFPGWRSLALTIGATLINVRPLLSSACLRTILWDLMPRWLSSDEGVHRVRSALALRRAERIDRDGTTHPCAENKIGQNDPGRRTPAGQTAHQILAQWPPGDRSGSVG